MNKLLLSIINILLLLIYIGCSSGSDVAGGSIEISNGYIAGVVLNSSGSYESGAIVKLIPFDFNPFKNSLDEILIDTTDSKGFYSFDSITVGRYNILTTDKSTMNGFVLNDINIDTVISDTIVSKLKANGIIDIVLTEEMKNGGYVYILGTDIVDTISTDSVVKISNLPSGSYENVNYLSSNLSNEVKISEAVTVVSEISVSLPYEFVVLMIDVDTTDMINVLADIISENGGMPLLKSSSDFVLADTAGVDLIYISYIADLEQNKIDFLRSVDIPLICSKAEYYKALGFTVGVSNIYGYEENNRAIIDVDTHAITQGYFAADSSVEIYEDASSMPMMAWGSVWGSCTRIANGTLSQDHRVWFTFDAGDEMNGLNAPANRAGIAITKGRFLHESAIILFENTVNWAINR